MQTDDVSSIVPKRFVFPGSKAHYPTLLSFNIDYMWLQICPDFNSNTLKDCRQRLRITAFKDINEIKLDIAEMEIHEVTSSSSIPVASFDVLQKDDKLIIKLGGILQRDNTIDLSIRYSAGYYSREGIFRIGKPRSGFYFVFPSKGSLSNQAWTQGQASESKYWFPCLDDPQVRFPREIKVIVPENDFIVISNGEVAQKERNAWTWTERNPIPAYLTSVVIGKFAQEQEEYSHYHQDENSNNILLLYYWPKEIPKEEAMLTFATTPNMIRFFEKYFGMNYPYKSYSQVAVEEFELGGMENASCTTLTKNLLHDGIAAIDYTRDIEVISHELAHQWFGDLVTCRDWSNLWLNEGFATYCEVLYWESVKGPDYFCYKVIKIADEYFDESKRLYKRALVTRIYKHPDDLFDAHSYEKGGCVLHMLRNDIGDDDFRKSINLYLNTYKNKAVETDYLREIVESVSRKSMCQFFDQWVYRSGHPKLDVQFSLELPKDLPKIKIRVEQIEQKQEQEVISDGGNTDYGDLFEFNLDIRIVFSTVDIKNNDDDDVSNSLTKTISISKRITEHSTEIPKDSRIEWISIDPHFRILKEIKSIKITNETNEFQLKEMLKNQLRKGKDIAERIDSARLLRDHYSEDVVNELQSAVVSDHFYGVAIEAANTLGSYYQKDSYSKSNKAYQALVFCMNNDRKTFFKLHPEVRQAIVRNIGQFEKKESINLLNPLLHNKDESYFVRANLATAIGKSLKEDEISSSFGNADKEKMISQLKEIVKSSNSFRNVIATGAIEGLKELSKDNNRDTVIDIANFLIKNTTSENEYFKRLAATSALSKFLRAKNYNVDNEKNAKLEEINRKVFKRLLELLQDSKRKVKINACKAFAEPDAKPSMPDASTVETIEALVRVAERDIDAFVRREAERCANIIREWIKEWSDKPLTVKTSLRET
jgi:aminopeptidase N